VSGGCVAQIMKTDVREAGCIEDSFKCFLDLPGAVGVSISLDKNQILSQHLDQFWGQVMKDLLLWLCEFPQKQLFITIVPCILSEILQARSVNNSQFSTTVVD